jgi:uncharacterized membrane protein YphA (DoxX/SURF4 family)
MPSILSRLRTLWQNDPKGMSIDLLRVGLGLVWTMNLLFILVPSNQFFSGFQSVASGFQSSSLGGPGFASYVAAHATFFSNAVALLTGYLAVAFLLGFTTRFACFVGEVASVIFLITQFGSTFNLSGSGTDVGPHPLYILVYVILFAAGAGQYVAVDHWIWSTGRARFPRLSQWLASPYVSRPDERPAPPPPPRGRPAASARGFADQQFYNAAAVVAVLVVLGTFGAAYFGAVSAPAAPAASTGTTSYVYLSVGINPNNGMPQYTPSNFTVPKGEAVFTIIDSDAPVTWANCTCNVTGTVGGVEWLNGTPISHVNVSNAAHTFTIPALHLNVVTPGSTTITFTVYLNTTGTYTWNCLAPCGSQGYTGPPMGVAGYMTGTMSVV